MSWIDTLAYDAGGLVPVIAQDASTGEVLMLAYANREALELTSQTRRAHYWSRSRRSLWQKGQTSGHVQHVDEIRVDCDGDAVLYRVRQEGPACHTGNGSCFYRSAEDGELVQTRGGGHILSRVQETIRTREAERPEGSYTTYLFTQGIDKILKKIGEESTEAVIAAKNEDTAELCAESADLLFHLLVLLRARGIDLDQVWSVLEYRFGARSRVPGTAAKHPHS